MYIGHRKKYEIHYGADKPVSEGSLDMRDTYISYPMFTGDQGPQDSRHEGHVPCSPKSVQVAALLSLYRSTQAINTLEQYTAITILYTDMPCYFCEYNSKKYHCKEKKRVPPEIDRQ